MSFYYSDKERAMSEKLEREIAENSRELKRLNEQAAKLIVTEERKARKRDKEGT